MSLRLILFIIFIFVETKTRFIEFFKLEHPQTGQQVLLIGDCHGKERFASENRAAIINLANTLQAHVIVEDMSDYSMFARFLPKETYETVDFFSYHSMHSRKRLAYTSLSLTHHAKRKNISISNVEFRHGGGLGDYSFLPMQTYYNLLDRLVKTVWKKTKQYLSENHLICLQKIMPIISRCIEQDIFNEHMHPTYFDETSRGLSEIDLAFCLMLDILMMQDLMEQTEQNREKTIVMCAGAFHIDNINEMLCKMGYETIVHIEREASTFRELRLRDLFAKHVMRNQPIVKCASRISIGFNDCKRVYWSVTKKAVVSGAALTTLASMFYVYSQRFSW